MDGGDGKFRPRAELDAAIVGGGEIAGRELRMEVRAVGPFGEAKAYTLLRVERTNDGSGFIERDREEMWPARDAQPERRSVADAENRRRATVIHIPIVHRSDHGRAIPRDGDPCSNVRRGDRANLMVIHGVGRDAERGAGEIEITWGRRKSGGPGLRGQ